MYIRTKDSVYDTSKGLYTPSIKMWAIGTVTIYDEDILKQSENLEDLCDEFVVDSKVNNAHCMYDWFDLCEELREDRFYSTDIVYGCIWTEWGLKYVAKLENGELVLI